MSTKKTIQINPELFKISGNRSKKNREKKDFTLNPIVAPNNLKNKLLNRIKEHKSKEIKSKSINGNNSINGSKSINGSNSINDNTYTDEFYGAMDYLSDLTKKQKINDSRQRSINTRTLKNYQDTESSFIRPNISLDLPEELKEPNKFIPQSNDIFNVNYKQTNDVPYGCLKGGNKKTYREWKEMTRPQDIHISDIVRPPTPPKKNVGTLSSQIGQIDLQQSHSTREDRLEQIKNKIRKMQDQETTIKQKSLEDFKKLEKQFSSPLLVDPLDELTDFDKKDSSTFNIDELLKQRESKIENEKTKTYLKKTVKRKFTLGKSDKLRRVSVLIKDRQTRKNIINTQKELKKTNITDVRKYLRQHGMIKVGSTCPPDILRKTFETALLTGDVINTNKDILLHNFLSGEHED